MSDTLTGLMWEKKDNLDATPNLGNPHDADNIYTWSSSGSDPDGSAFTDFLGELNDCESLDGSTVTGGFADHCDWRLPTSAELQTIVKLGAPGCGSGSPCIDEAIFGPTPASFYWSSTTIAGDPGLAWGPFFFDGSPSYDGKINDYYVRGVRGGS